MECHYCDERASFQVSEDGCPAALGACQRHLRRLVETITSLGSAARVTRASREG